MYYTKYICIVGALGGNMGILIMLFIFMASINLLFCIEVLEFSCYRFACRDFGGVGWCES